MKNYGLKARSFKGHIAHLTFMHEIFSENLLSCHSSGNPKTQITKRWMVVACEDLYKSFTFYLHRRKGKVSKTSPHSMLSLMVFSRDSDDGGRPN